MELEVRVEPEALHFVRYPFWPASVRKRPAVPAERFTGWNPRTSPPSLILDTGEVLFVPTASQAEVHAWALTEGLRTLDGLDVWALLLEPFLDTEFTPQHEGRTLSLLEAEGFPPEQVRAWRSRVGPKMLLANSLWWEWGHLGQYDMLTAFAKFSTPWTFRRLYWDSMLKGAGRNSPEPPTA